MSLLQGVSDILDAWLGLAGNDRYGVTPRYQSEAAAMDLLGRNRLRPALEPPPIHEAMTILQENLFRYRRGRAWGDNWRWRKSLCLPRRNDPTQKPLSEGMDTENIDPGRALCSLAAGLLGDKWVDQLPICDGLVGHDARSLRIDLAHRRHRTHYELFAINFGENDPGSGLDTPLSAAIGLLQCGLIYILSRQMGFIDVRLHSDHHILDAESIDLVVLAPGGWYRFSDDQTERYSLEWLQDSINRGLGDYLGEQNFRMRLRFQVLNDQFLTNFKDLMTEVALFRAGALTLRDDLPEPGE